MAKTTVLYDGVPLAAVSTVVWEFRTGVVPYQTTFTVHKKNWERLAQKLGKPLRLHITDPRGVKTIVEKVYLLHEEPSDGPNRVSFRVSDGRYLWDYKSIFREYNILKRTGSINLKGEKLPIEKKVVVDKFYYRPYSLNGGGTKRWTSKAALEDVLHQVEPGNFKVVSYPISLEAEERDGSFSLQNIRISDPANVALSRLLSFIPGAQIYIDRGGRVIVFDGTDLQASIQNFNRLPPSTYDGERAVVVRKRGIRPSVIRVHYQREVEVVIEFEDDYTTDTYTPPQRVDMFAENVVLTTDPSTTITEWDPEEDDFIFKEDVPAGTWVNMIDWLRAMNDLDPSNSWPWTFKTISENWIHGDLDGSLGNHALELDKDGRLAARVGTLKKHFRQTYRINRRLMERTTNIKAYRVGLLDPVTGATGKSLLWGQYCLIPSRKGDVFRQFTPLTSGGGLYINVDTLDAHKQSNQELTGSPPSPADIVFVDADIGIFRVEWQLDPIGLTKTIVPSHLVGRDGGPILMSGDLSNQDNSVMFFDAAIEHTPTDGIFLAKSTEYHAIVTVIPAAPNNAKKYHVVEVKLQDIADIFRSNFGDPGSGPPMDVFISPSELTARYAWYQDSDAKRTAKKLLGMDIDDLNAAGWPQGEPLRGYRFVNEQPEISSHSRAVAAEIYARFADSIKGRVSTIVNKTSSAEKILEGNMNMTSVNVAPAPSAKTTAIYSFPGNHPQLSRFAMLSEGSRPLILGILPFGKSQ